MSMAWFTFYDSGVTDLFFSNLIAEFFALSFTIFSGNGYLGTTERDISVFFHNFHLIQWIQQDKIYRKFTDWSKVFSTQIVA